MENIRFEYTEKAVSPWGGMRLLKELIDRTGIHQQLQEEELPSPGSNRGYCASDVIESFWVSVWLGASRFAHSALMRYDEVLPEIFRWTKGVPSQSTYSRFFGKFDAEKNTKIFTSLNQWWFNQLSIKNITVDFDSSVVTRYGQQQGSQKGYNPIKPGRLSHHPIMAFLAETRMVINGWMRAGNTVAMTDIESFMDETFAMVANKSVGLVRADSGFYSARVFDYLENKPLNYVIAAKMFLPLKQKIIGTTQWFTAADGIDYSELHYKSDRWKKSRRVVIIRQDTGKRPKATGKLLFEDMEQKKIYRYAAFVTNMDLPAEQIWMMYRNRADAENRIRELKYDFGMDSFVMQKLPATDAAFRFILIAYNLMALFKHLVMQGKHHHTLSTIRFKCIAIGSYLVKQSRQRILKLVVPFSKRQWMDGLFQKARDATIPFSISIA
jgi:hypothetical protein